MPKISRDENTYGLYFLPVTLRCLLEIQTRIAVSW